MNRDIQMETTVDEMVLQTKPLCNSIHGREGPDEIGRNPDAKEQMIDTSKGDVATAENEGANESHPVLTEGSA
jgi:hypothetical protein